MHQVLKDFKPKEEGQADYSALVISFCKRLPTSSKAPSFFKGWVGDVLMSLLGCTRYGGKMVVKNSKNEWCIMPGFHPFAGSFKWFVNVETF